MKFNKFISPILALLATSFVFLALEFFISLNFFPGHLTESHPIAVTVRYYSLVIPQHLMSQKPTLNLHLILGIILVVLGLFQINERARVRFPKLHRVLGRFYFSVGAFATIVGLVLSPKAIGGMSTQLAFITFGSIWFITAFKAYKYAVQRNIRSHRAWAIYNYVATLATGLIRPMLLFWGTILSQQKIEFLFSLACWSAILMSLILSLYLKNQFNQKK